MNASGCARERFSPRERQIIEALAAAKPINAIAADLCLTRDKSYIKMIYVKAEVHSARELMFKCWTQNGLVTDHRTESLGCA